jgi:photosystem II stability/assembly factor-like uncharacterized protein
MKMFKKDGKTAVLVSPGFGAGFSTWNKPEMAVDFDLVEAFLSGDKTRFAYIVNEKYNADDSLYLGGMDGLIVVWVDGGKKFRVEEYDGAEHVEVFKGIEWFTA